MNSSIIPINLSLECHGAKTAGPRRPWARTLLERIKVIYDLSHAGQRVASGRAEGLISGCKQLEHGSKMTVTESLSPGQSRETVSVTPAKRISFWLLAGAMVFIVALKEDRVGWPHWHFFGWPLMAGALGLALFQKDRLWAKTSVLFAYTIGILWITRVDGDTSNWHVLELTLTLGVGIVLVPALLAKYWLKTPLDYQWLNGPWTIRMWIWLPLGFAIAFVLLWAYFFIWTPTLHHSWPLPLEGDRTEALWRIFWGCNLVGVWDELAWINFVFVLLLRNFSFWEANFGQAVFFTAFLYDMAFFGVGPILIFAFALIQGFTYKRTQSLLYIVFLHLLIDTALFYMIANRWYPGWGWHP